MWPAWRCWPAPGSPPGGAELPLAASWRSRPLPSSPAGSPRSSPSRPASAANWPPSSPSEPKTRAKRAIVLHARPPRKPGCSAGALPEIDTKRTLIARSSIGSARGQLPLLLRDRFAPRADSGPVPGVAGGCCSDRCTRRGRAADAVHRRSASGPGTRGGRCRSSARRSRSRAAPAEVSGRSALRWR